MIGRKEGRGAMVVTAVRANVYREAPRPSMGDMVLLSPSFVEGIKEGIEDYHEGRIESWNQVKKELGIG